MFGSGTIYVYYIDFTTNKIKSNQIKSNQIKSKKYIYHYKKLNNIVG